MCGAPTELGGLEFGTGSQWPRRLVWEAAEDRRKILGRRRRTIMTGGAFGTKTRRAHRCTECFALVVAPDDRWDRER
jgi:hypothetical protein